jgi:hypothetical protein
MKGKDSSLGLGMTLAVISNESERSFSSFFKGDKEDAEGFDN